MPVLYEKRNHVGWLTLSRPEARNCWGDDFNEEMARSLRPPQSRWGSGLLRPGSAGAAVAAPPEPSYLGLEHIGPRVRGIDDVIAERKSKGAEFTVEPKTIRPTWPKFALRLG